MPIKDIEKRKEVARKRYWRNPEKHRKAALNWYKAHRTKVSERRKKRYIKNHEEILAKRKIDRKLNATRILLNKAKVRAREQNLPFNIDLSDIIVPKVCPVLGIKLKRGIGKATSNSPTLDKVISKLGYIKGNVRIISWRANRLKSDATLDELKAIIKYIEDSCN